MQEEISRVGSIRSDEAIPRTLIMNGSVNDKKNSKIDICHGKGKYLLQVYEKAKNY